MGYRFYETAAEEGFLNYEETVMYPFGYGLSYTDFTQEMGELHVGTVGPIRQRRMWFMMHPILTTAISLWQKTDLILRRANLPIFPEKTVLPTLQRQRQSRQAMNWPERCRETQVTVDEMVNLIAFGGHQNAEVNSVGKIRILDTDGPAGVNSSTLGVFGTGFCSEVVLAQTWNVDLAKEYSMAMAREFADFHITGWYAPSMNMHRSAFGGRDFEYYSEDGCLSAGMAVAEAEGAVEMGMYPFIKHLVLNEQEINRNALLCTWTTEQAMRQEMKPGTKVAESILFGECASGFGCGV